MASGGGAAWRFPIVRASAEPISLSPLIIVGGPTGCLSGHQDPAVSAVAELERPA
jgi:hypothetical protein